MLPQSQLLNAVNHATRKLASSERLDDVLPEVLTICVEAAGAEGGTIYTHNKAKKTLEFRHVLPEASKAALQFSDIPDDFGVAGSAFQDRATKITTFEPKTDDEFARKTGVVVRSMITVPLMMGDEEPIGVVQLINKREGDFDGSDQMVLETVSAVSTLAFLNFQLIEEQSRASQLLGMGRVAHDIKNMAFALEANIGFSGETIQNATERAHQLGDESMMASLDDIQIMFGELTGSIERIKRYTTLMSDLSAGQRPTPVLEKGRMGDTISLAAAYLESEGRKHKVQLAYEIDANAPEIYFDDMYVFRIVQNLVSNAIKAVGESRDDANVGAVCIRYRVAGNNHILEVQDNGPGMTPDIAERILSGNAKSVWNKSAGSGWGTKIVLELAAAQDARVEIDSSPGNGATFRVVFTDHAHSSASA